MTKEIMNYFSSRKHWIPDSKLTQIQRNSMIQLEQKGIVYRSNESFLGGTPELFWFVYKEKLLNEMNKPVAVNKSKTIGPKRKSQRRTKRRTNKKIKQNPIIGKWEIALGIVTLLIIIFS